MRDLASYALLLTVLTATAHADAALFKVVPESSTVAYHIHAAANLHRVDALSRRVEGTATIDANGSAQIALRVPVDSFDSRNAKRDAHMKEVTEAARFPAVEVKGVIDGIGVPASFPATSKKTVRVQVTLHGISRTVDAPVTMVFESANKVAASSTFTISLDSFEVERPKMMLWTVADDVRIDARLTFVR